MQAPDLTSRSKESETPRISVSLSPANTNKIVSPNGVAGKDEVKEKRKSSVWITPEDRAAIRLSSRAQLVSKTTNRILDFVRLTCIIGVGQNNGDAIVLVLERSATVQQLADLVAAKHLFNKISETMGVGPENRDAFVAEVEKRQPILITQVFTPGMLALGFDEIVGHVLGFNDVITVAFLDVTSNPSRTPTLHNFSLDASDRAVPLPTNMIAPGGGGRPPFDDSLLGLLSNMEAIAYLQDFCIEEYFVEPLLLYLDIEALQTCNEDTVIDYCRYIYYTYFAPTAPVSVNIATDVKRVLASKVANMDDLDVTMYDDTQEQVLATMGSFLHPRFLASKYFAQLEETRRADPAKYMKANIQAFQISYPVDMKSIKKCTEIVLNPTHPTSQQLLTASFNNNTPIDWANPNDWREVLLGHLVRRHDSDAAGPVRGYFDNTVRKRWELKQRRIQKEKKLSKFFGQRVGADEMRAQVVKAVTLGGDLVERGLGARLGAGTAVLTLEDVLKAVEDVDKEGGEDDAALRRKKIEKLRNIFGDQTPVAPPSTSEKSMSNESLDTEEPVDTTNDLTPAARKLLNKRNKKLVGILGETVDSKHVVGGGEVALGGVRQSFAAAPPTGGPGRGSIISPISQLPTSANIHTHRVSIGFEVGTPAGGGTGRAAMSPPPVLLEDIPTMSMFETEEDALAHGFHKSDTSDHDIDLSLDDETLISKEMRKKRIDKLSKMFGKRVTNYDVVVDASNKNSKGKTFEQKVMDRRKSSKVEARIGATLTTQERRSVAAGPPKARPTMSPTESALLEEDEEDPGNVVNDAADDDDSAGKRLYNFITSMASVIQHTENFNDLLDLVGSLANEITGKSGGEDAESDEGDDEAHAEAIKNRRVAKLKKFFKMSGVTVRDYVDTQIIHVLRVQIKILVSDPAELDVLREEATTLLSILSTRSPDFQQQLDMGGCSPQVKKVSNFGALKQSSASAGKYPPNTTPGTQANFAGGK
ncbi:hypothetical protein BC830DRAFT_1224421 [Chytriomyces sp. MP71]|nr:hypothetical protein BC830DRAFT_1224421 [Chytriomyces sp. MP71]